MVCLFRVQREHLFKINRFITLVPFQGVVSGGTAGIALAFSVARVEAVRALWPGTLLGKDRRFVLKPACRSRSFHVRMVLVRQRCLSAEGGDSPRRSVSFTLDNTYSMETKMTRNTTFGMAELEKERTIGGIGKTTVARRADHRPRRLRGAQAGDRRSALERFDRHRLLSADQSRHPAGPDRRSLRDDRTLLRTPARRQGKAAPSEGNQRRLGISESGAPLDRHGGSQGILPNHDAAHEGAMAERRRTARLQGGDAGVRARQLGGRHESADMLCAETRLQAGLLHASATTRCRRNINRPCGCCTTCRCSMPSRKTTRHGAPAHIRTSIA